MKPKVNNNTLNLQSLNYKSVGQFGNINNNSTENIQVNFSHEMYKNTLHKFTINFVQ